MNHNESKIQAEIVKHLRGLGIFCHSCPNDFVRDARSMGTAVTMGLFPGVADLVVWWPTGIGYLEIKTDTGRLSAAQEKFKARCIEKGIRYDVARSVDDVLP